MSQPSANVVDLSARPPGPREQAAVRAEAAPTPWSQGSAVLTHSGVSMELQRLEAILRSAELLILELKGDGSIVQAGGPLLARLNFTPAALAGARLERLFPDAQASGLFTDLGAVLNTGQPACVVFRCQLGGRPGYLRIDLSLARAGADPRLFGVVQDVSDLATLIRCVDESEGRYKALMRSFNDLLFTVDETPVIRSVNLRAAERYSTAADAWLNRRFADVLDPESAELFERRIGRVLKSGQPSRWEGPLLVSGKQVYFDVIWSPLIESDGRCRQVVGVCRDLTDRIETQQLLREAEIRYRTIIDCIEDLVYVLDADSRVLSANQHAAQLVKQTTTKVVGQKFSSLVHGELVEVHEQRLRRVLETGSTEAFEGRVELGGEERIMSVVLSPLKRGNEVLAVVGVARDRTAERAIEERLHHTQKMETLGAMAGGMAHDFNNLLVGMLTNAGLIRSQLPADSPLLGPMELIERSASAAASLVQQMLAYAGQGNSQTQLVSLNQVVGDVLALWRPQLKAGVEVREALADDLPPIEADASQLTQVAMNLLLNAAEAMPDGGVITLTTALRTPEQLRDLAVDWPAGLSAVELAVEDRGVGIPPDLLKKVFEPYFTTKKHGRGLGLAVVFGVLQRHKGQLKVQSLPGLGTTFRLYFRPSGSVAAVQDVSVPSDSLVQRLPKGSDAMVVLASGSALGQQIETTLSTLGYDVYMAETPEELAELTTQFTIRLVAADRQLVDGAAQQAAIKQLQQSHPSLRWLWLSHAPAWVTQDSSWTGGLLTVPARHSHEQLAKLVRKAIET